jgi:4-hydroxy-3-methylbut-2-enyl diphosphate reductase
MGVKRAVDAAYMLFDEAKRGAAYTYGPLIHNKTVLETLAGHNITVIDGELPPLEGAAVIIRAHGAPPEIEAELHRRGARVKDATCPKVKAVQLLAQKLSGEGYRVFLAGDAGHAEVRGILGYAPSCVCVSTVEEAEKAAQNAGLPEKAALIGQTTFSRGGYQRIAVALKKQLPGLVTKNTLCPATGERETALRSLCGQVDAVVIAGGRDSANTQALAEVAGSMGTPVFLVESAAELPPMPETVRTVGIAAGASTPLEIIDEIEGFLKSGSP